MLARFKWPILLAGIGLALEVVVVLAFLNIFRDSGTSFVVPGEVSINITKPGKYTLWHEARTMINGQLLTFPDALPSGTTINVLGQPEGTPIVLRRGGSAHMDKAGTRRVAVGELKFASPGHYRITVSGLPEKRTFYLEQSKFLRTFLTIMICGFTGLLLFVGAIAFGIYVFIQIINARRSPSSPVSV